MQESAVPERTWGAGGITRTSLLVVFYSFLVALAYHRANANISTWRFTHWLFDYEHEFLKRGLIGEIFRWIDVEINPVLAVVVSRIALAFLALIFVFLLTRIDFLHKKKEIWLFGAVVILCPFTLQHFINDIGRFDVFVVLVSLVPIFVISRDSRVVCKAVSIVLAMIVALLIHEASYLSTVPLVMAYWYYCDRDRSSWVAQGVALLLLTSATALISTSGLVTGFTFNEHLALLQRQYEFVSPESLLVLHAGGVAENVALTIQHAFTPARLAHHLYLFFLLSPFFWLIATLCHSLLKIGDRRLAFLLLAALSPLALYPLGYDHFRWWSLAMMNLLLVIVLLALRNNSVSNAIAKHVSEHPVAYWLTVGLALPLGPVLVMHSFDFIV